MPHAAIDHRERDAVLARQHADRRPARQEVLDHLPGHITRIGRYALRRQTVVASEDEQLGLYQNWRMRLQNFTDLVRQPFQLAE